MADQINLVPLDQIIEKAELIYKKLVAAEKKIDDLGKIKLTLAFSDDFRKSARSLDELARALKVFTDITNLNVEESVKVIQSLIQAVNKMDAAFDDSKFQSKNFVALIKALERLLNFKVGSGGAAKLGAVVRNVTEVINQLSSLSSRTSNLADVEQLTKAFKTVGLGLKTLFDVISNQKIDSKKIKEIATIYGALSVTLQLISGVARKLPGSQSFSEISTIFQKLGQGLSNLVRATRGFTVKDARNIIVIFTGLSVAFTLISTVLRRLPGGDAFERFSRTINLLGTGLTALARAGKNINLSSTISKTLKVYIQILSGLGKALKGFKNATFPDIGAMLHGLTESLNQISKLNIRDLKNIQPVFREFVKGINELRGVKIDERLAGRIEQILKSLSAVSSGVNVNKVGTNLGTNLGDGFTRGLRLSIRDQVLANLIASVIKAAVRAFNPIALIRQVKNFEKAVFDSIVHIKQGLLSLGNTFRQVGDDIKDAGFRLIQNFGLGKLISSEAFTAAVGFDKLSTQIKVFGDLTEEEVQHAQDFANEIGIRYPLSSNEALNATLQLIKAGRELSQIEFILPSAADLAALSDSGSIETSTNTLIAAQAQFREFSEGVPATFENIAKAADILAAGADLSTASVESLSLGISNVGPIATQYNLTLEDTVAILATFEDANLRGAEAGTALRSLLTNLNTNVARNQLKSLGIQLTDRTTGQFRDFSDIITDIQASLDKPIPISNIPGLSATDQTRMKEAQRVLASAQRNLLLWNDGLAAGSDDQEKRNQKIAEFQRQIGQATSVIQSLTNSESEAAEIIGFTNKTQEEQVRIIKNLFGAYGQTGAAILLANGGFDELRDSMGEVETAAIRAQQLMDNFSGDVEQLRGSVETLMTEAFLPLIQRAFRPIVQIGRKVVDFFIELPDPILETVSTALLLASTLATVVGAIAIGVGFLIQFAGVISTVSAGFVALLFDGAALVAGLGAIITAFVSLVAIGTLVVGGLLAVSAAVTTTFNLIEDNVGGAGDAFERVRYNVEQVLIVFGQIIGVASEIAQIALGDLFGKNAEEQGKKLTQILYGILRPLTQFRTAAEQFLVFISLFRDFLGLAQDMSRADDLIAQAQQSVGIPPGVIQSLKDGTDVFDKYSRAVAAFTKTGLAKRLFGDDVQVGDVGLFFQQAALELETFSRSVRKIVGGGFNLLFGDRRAALADIKSGVGGLISQLLTFVGNLILSRGGQLKQTFISAVFDFQAGNIRSGLDNFIAFILSSLRDLLIANRGTVVAIATQLFSTLLPGGFIAYIFDLIGLKEIAATIRAPLQFVKDAFSNLLNTLFDIAEGQSIEDAVFGNFGPVAGAVVRAILKVIKFIDKLVGAVRGIVEALFGDEEVTDPANNILTRVFETVGTAFDTLERLVLAPLNSTIALLIENAKKVLAAFAPVGQAILSTFHRAFGPVAEIISNALSGGGLDVGALLSAFVSAITTVVSGIPDILGTLFKYTGALIGSNFLISLGQQLQEGDFGGALQTVATEFVSLIGRAVDLIAGLVGTTLVNIGASVGSPFLVALGTQLKEGEYETALQTAASGLVDLIGKAIAKIPELLGTALTNIGSTIGSAFLVELGTQIAASDFEAAINTAAYQLGYLIGDVVVKTAELLGTILTNVGLTIGSALLSIFGTQVEVADFGAVNGSAINAVAKMIGDVVTAAVGVLGSFITGIGDSTGNAFLSELGRQLREGDFSFNIAQVGGALTSLVTQAIAKIPELIESAGIVLGSPVLEALGRHVKEGEWGDVIVDIAEGLRDIIQAAFALVPDLLESAGSFLNIPTLALLGATVGGILDRISTSLGTILTLPLSLLGEVIDFIQNLLHLLRGLPDILKLVLAAGAIYAIGRALSNLNTVLPLVVGGLRSLYIQVLTASPIIRTFFLTRLPAALSAARTAFSKFLLPLAKVLFILAIFKNLISGINVLLEGGTIGEAFGDFLAGLASDLLGFLGIDFPKDQILVQLNQLLAAVELVLLDVVNRIKTAVQNIADGIVLTMLDAISRITILGGLVQEGFQVDYFRIAEAFDPARAAEFSGLNFFRRLGDVLGDNANLGLVQTQLRARWSDIWANFVLIDFEAVAREQPTDLGNIFATALAAGAGTEASVHILRNFGVDVLKTAFEEAAKVAPEVVQGLDLSALMSELHLRITTGEFTLPEAQALLIQIQELRPDLTDEQVQAFIDNVYAEVSRRGELLLGTGDGQGNPVTVPVDAEIDPTVLPPQDGSTPDADVQAAMDAYFEMTGGMGPQVAVTTTVAPIPVVGDVAQFQSDVQSAMDLAASGAVTFTPTVTVAPAVSSLPALPESVEVPTNADSAAAFAGSLQLVVQRIQELVSAAPTFVEQATAMVTPIQTLTLEISNLKLGVEEQIPLTQTLIDTFLQSVQDKTGQTIIKLAELRTGFTLLVGSILTTTTIATVSFITFQVAVVIWANVTVNQVRRVTTAVSELNTKLQEALTAIAAVDAAKEAQEAGGIQVDGGGAYGVNTFPGGVFRILERGQSELYKENGRTYLLSADHGEVIPLPFSRGAGAAPQQPQRGPIQNGNGASGGVTINEGNIQISLSGLTPQNAQQVVAQLQPMIRKELDSRNATIRNRLRTGHR